MARKVPRGRRERWYRSITTFPPFVSSLPSSCPSSLRVLPPFVSFLPSCPSMRQSLLFSTYSVVSSPLLGQSIVPLPLLPRFVFFLPSCPPFLPSCPSSLRALPPFTSIDEAEPVLLYLLSDFISFVGAVHSASPPPPSLCVLPPFVSSLPPFVSFLPSCPSSLHVLPPFVSFLFNRPSTP